MELVNIPGIPIERSVFEENKSRRLVRFDELAAEFDIDQSSDASGLGNLDG